MACLVSHKFRFVFCHIPRTGGSSFSEYIRKFCARRRELGREHGSLIEISHLPLADLKKLYFKNHNWDDYLKFTIVRNPFDRMASLFCHLSGPRQERQWSSFREMMADIDTNWDQYMRPRYGQLTFWPGDKYLLGPNGNLLADKFIRFENFKREIVDVCEQLGIKIPLEDYDTKPGRYPHVNRSDRKPYQEYYDDFCKEVVERRYGWELSEFGYGFNV